MKLKDCFENMISGEWGEECLVSDKGTKILRTTNFTNIGKINYSDVVERKINDAKIDKKRLKYGDIILEKSGGTDKTPVGRVVFCDEDIEADTYLCNNFTVGLRTQKDYFAKYLFYLMFFYHLQGRTLSLQNKTTGIRNLKVDSYLNCEINIPSKPDQQRIADELDKVSGLIEKRQKQLEKLDLLIKSRFVEMVNRNNKEIKSFGDICDFLRNGANIKQVKGAGGYPITRIETLSNGVFNESRLGYADIYDLTKYNSYVLHYGDILISHINSLVYLGRAVQYKNTVCQPVIHGMNLLCARIKDKYNATYIEWYFKTAKARLYINSIAKKAVNQASITVTDLKKMPIEFVSLELQNQFADFVEKVEQNKSKIKNSLDKLITLKKALMQKYFG